MQVAFPGGSSCVYLPPDTCVQVTSRKTAVGRLKCRDDPIHPDHSRSEFARPTPSSPNAWAFGSSRRPKQRRLAARHDRAQATLALEQRYEDAGPTMATVSGARSLN